MNKNGTIQQWIIGVINNSDGSATVRTVYGQIDGAQQTADVHIKAGKNQGRANETSAFEQARKEALSKWKKQKDKAYTEVVPISRPSFRPMLAKEYSKHKDTVSFPSFIQCKLDGIRAVAIKKDNKVVLISRQNKEIINVEHINEELNQVMRNGEAWDGELYRHDVRFQTLISWIKRKQPKSQLVQYHCYDAFGSGPFIDRYDVVVKRIHDDLKHIRTVPTIEVTSHIAIKSAHDSFVANGYEGGMLRVGDCLYIEGYRSSQLLKIKDFKDDEFKIVGAREGKGKFEGCCIFELETPQGKRFECLPEGTMAERANYWQNRANYIGRMFTVRYFELTDDGVPRFPIGKGVRDF